VVARSAERFQRQAVVSDLVTVLAGYEDAAELGVEWVPNVVEPPSAPAGVPSPDHDLLFFGNLSYPPNVAALSALRAMWPDLLAARPGTTVLVAGAHPTAPVRALVEAAGWTLVPHFDDLGALCARSRLAVVPLEHATGIQNKVLEAAAAGMAQVITPEAAAGFPPDAPFGPVPLGPAFVDEVVRLLDHPDVAAKAGDVAADYVRRTFSAAPWGDWLAARLPAGSRGSAPGSAPR
jgi:hypothetical protein